MNTNGEDFINAICNRLRNEGKLCTDNQICTLIRSLSHNEMNQIVTFGITDKWKRENIDKLRSLNNIQ